MFILNKTICKIYLEEYFQLLINSKYLCTLKNILVSQRIFHPNCCSNATNFALLGLKQTIELSKFIQFACIDGTKEPSNGTTVITAGWGSIVECTSKSDCKEPDILQATKFQVVSREQCNKELVEAYPVLENSITEDYICAKDDDSGLCRGDFGGIKKSHPELWQMGQKANAYLSPNYFLKAASPYQLAASWSK